MIGLVHHIIPVEVVNKARKKDAKVARLYRQLEETPGGVNDPAYAALYNEMVKTIEQSRVKF